MEKERLIINCDGGSRGNPGPAASAFVATKSAKVIHKEGKYLGNETNNVAEYEAVLLAIEWVTKQLKNNKEEIIINLDSQLVERQLNGKYKIKNPRLKILADQIKFLILKSSLLIKFRWDYRNKNKLADSLVNKTLDTSTGKLKIFT